MRMILLDITYPLIFILFLNIGSYTSVWAQILVFGSHVARTKKRTYVLQYRYLCTVSIKIICRPPKSNERCNYKWLYYVIKGCDRRRYYIMQIWKVSFYFCLFCNTTYFLKTYMIFHCIEHYWPGPPLSIRLLCTISGRPFPPRKQRRLFALLSL